MIEAKRKEYLKKIENDGNFILDEACVNILERFNKLRTDRRRRVISCGLTGRPKRKLR